MLLVGIDIFMKFYDQSLVSTLFYLSVSQFLADREKAGLAKWSTSRLWTFLISLVGILKKCHVSYFYVFGIVRSIPFLGHSRCSPNYTVQWHMQRKLSHHISLTSHHISSLSLQSSTSPYWATKFSYWATAQCTSLYWITNRHWYTMYMYTQLLHLHTEPPHAFAKVQIQIVKPLHPCTKPQIYIHPCIYILSQHVPILSHISILNHHISKKATTSSFWANISLNWTPPPPTSNPTWPGMASLFGMTWHL